MKSYLTHHPDAFAFTAKSQLAIINDPDGFAQRAEGALAAETA